METQKSQMVNLSFKSGFCFPTKSLLHSCDTKAGVSLVAGFSRSKVAHPGGTLWWASTALPATWRAPAINLALASLWPFNRSEASI